MRLASTVFFTLPLSSYFRVEKNSQKNEDVNMIKVFLLVESQREILN